MLETCALPVVTLTGVSLVCVRGLDLLCHKDGTLVRVLHVAHSCSPFLTFTHGVKWKVARQQAT